MVSTTSYQGLHGRGRSGWPRLYVSQQRGASGSDTNESTSPNPHPGEATQVPSSLTRPPIAQTFQLKRFRQKRPRDPATQETPPAADRPGKPQYGRDYFTGK